MGKVGAVVGVVVLVVAPAVAEERAGMVGLAGREDFVELLLEDIG